MSNLLFYIKGIRDELQSPLKSKLHEIGATPLEDPRNHTQDGVQWALVHKSRARDKAITGKLDTLDLVIYLDEGYNGCVLETEIQFRPGTCQCWRAGTQFVIHDFDSLNKYINGVSPEDVVYLEPSNWIRPRHILIALDILCQGFRSTHGDSSLPELTDINIQTSLELSLHAKMTEKCEWWTRGLCASSVKTLVERLQCEKVADTHRGTIIHQCLDAKKSIGEISNLGTHLRKDTGEHREALAMAKSSALKAVQNLHQTILEARTL